MVENGHGFGHQGHSMKNVEMESGQSDQNKKFQKRSQTMIHWDGAISSIG